MGESFWKQVTRLLRSKKNRKYQIALFLLLAVIVSLGTVVALRLSGEAMTHREKVLDCHFAGNAAHTHNDDCYDANGALVCPLAERPLHTHDASCYTAETFLTCGREESAGHQHTADCYTLVRGGLTCGQEESEDHEHTDDCYDWHEELTCGYSEGEGAHEHTDACYETVETITCGLEELTEEHVHGEECFVVVELSGDEVAELHSEPAGEIETGEAAGEPDDADGAAADGEEPAEEPARADEAAGAEEAEIEVADLTEGDFDAEELFEDTEDVDDVQGEQGGDPNADVEIYADWDRMFAGLELTGNWDEDLITVAKTQLGYTESTANYIINSEGKTKGYTRYGEWYGSPYGDWCAMFVSFCLNYAGIPTDAMPLEASCPRWVEKLSDRDMYAEAGTYAPRSGDLIFFTRNGYSAAHVGIVYDVEDGVIETIEGNSANTVRYVKYGSNDWHILGYGVLPENPEPAAILAAEMPAQIFEAWAGDVKVSVYAPEGAFPEGTVMYVSLVEDEDVIQTIADAVDGEVASVQAVDITFYDSDQNELEPATAIQVSMTSAAVAAAEESVVIHLSDDGETTVMDKADADSAEDEVIFDADAFSVYAIVGTTIEKNVLASDGKTYKITVTYGADAGIPGGAELAIREIVQQTEAADRATEYEKYLAETVEALGYESGALSYARFFDISIVDGNGKDVQPAEGSEVSVNIRLDDKEEDIETRVVHFSDEAEVLDAQTDGRTVSFETSGFSVYAIVQGPSAIPLGWSKISSVGELVSLGSSGLYVGHTDGYYFTNEITEINGTRTGITKTKPMQTFPGEDAVLYYFEPVNGASDQFKVYCLNGEEKQYVIQTDNSLNFTKEDQAMVFTVEPFGNTANTFRVKGNDNFYWNMQGGADGASFAAWNSATDGNAKLIFWRYDSTDSDPYGLDGKTYGIMNWNGGVAGKAMMASSATDNSLDALSLTVMSKKDNNADKLFVPNDSEISMWSFQWISGDTYYLTANVDGIKKYLRVSAGGLSLVSTADEACRIQVIPGTGTHAGEICLKSGNATLTFSGSVDTGFSVGGTVGSEWLKLVEVSELTSDYFMTYSASKVSISDSNVTNGSHIIIYTRAWDDANKKYVFYAIDHDGSLVPCYESGDSIQWVGSRLNTLLWNFVEYYWDGTNDPNYYYELYNQYSEKYIAPQVTDGQILSDDTIGINLNGRRNGRYYSSILAWDDTNYAYAGLKVEDGKIVSCPISETDDFYFAVMEDIAVDDYPTPVETVDHTQYGITMKIADYGTKQNGWNEQDIFLGSKEGGAVKYTEPGLLSTHLGEDGYPENRSGESMSTLFAGAQDVNYLFIGSTYSGSGYFEFDSSQNFASLNEDGSFTVYKELGTMDETSKESLKHGQFMPFNDLEAGYFASVNGKNLYTATLSQLPNNDPRKYEQMYLVRKPDYYFGVEIEASFTQTPNGLDAWGHDIVYEFTGDDDFWLYVDGELIIDLGGIHSALLGTVNYSTGDVTYVDGQGHTVNTKLRDLFERNYRGRTPGASDEDVAAYLAQYFDEGSTIFKDYSSHTMRIFYMERGAGASNLHMRFNLASVKPGTVELSKKLSNVDATESVLAEFPYQIYYMDDTGAEHRLKGNSKEGIRVYYKDTINEVTYKEQYPVDGITYDDIFLLKPGEIAVIELPEKAVSYKIVECGVNTDVYSGVTVNDEKVSGTAVGENRSDFAIKYDTSENRPRVTYENIVNPEALRTLTITERLYKEDGKTAISYEDDQETFSFRLYFGTEFDTELTLTNMYTYHVKDPAQNYCWWNEAEQKFESTGKTDYTDLTEEEKAAASFSTSIYGSITKIPASYTVEVRQVLVGTRFKVEERPWEIPDGYSFQKYIYTHETQEEELTSAEGGVAGIIAAKDDPHVDICNLRGWGLRVNKLWSDADYMTARDATYFALYTDDGSGNLTPVDGSVRQMTQSVTTLYWYYLTLPVPDVKFDNYLIWEVEVENPTVNPDGEVTAYSSIQRIENDETLELKGVQKGETATSDYTYTVLYKKGATTEDSNVRVDTVTNNRPGIVLKKTTWNGTPLAGASFTLTDADGNTIGTFTSDSEGQITVAFLSDDKDYTLTETKAPRGYHGLEGPMTLRLSDGNVEVSGIDGVYYTLTQGNGSTPTLTIKNRPYTFQVVKKDADTGELLSGVKFALYKQYTVGGVTSIETSPLLGYEELVTDENGILPKLDNTLPAGTYQLREGEPLEGYQKLSAYINFTVSETGTITLGAHPDEAALTGEPAADGSIPYVLTIQNIQRKDVSFKKVDNANTNIVLEGAEFDLYRVEDGQKTLLYSKLTSGKDGLLAKGSETVFSLRLGTYELVETKAPAGYNQKDAAITIQVMQNGVTYDEGLSSISKGSYDGATRTYTLVITNSTGYVLPHTGGIGTTIFYVVGGILVVGAAALLITKRRVRRDEEDDN